MFNDDELHCGAEMEMASCENEVLKEKIILLKEEIEFLNSDRETKASLREKLKSLESENKKLREETSRKYLPTLGELLDRLTITQIKEVKIPEHKEKYAQEIKDILHDVNISLSEGGVVFDGDMLRALIVLAQYNLHIWHNESNFRRGIKEGNDLELTHGLNSIRNTAKNYIQDRLGGRKDYKIDNVEAFPQWVPSW